MFIITMLLMNGNISYFSPCNISQIEVVFLFKAWRRNGKLHFNFKALTPT